MNRKKRIILTLSLSLLIFISICLSVGLIRQRQKNTNEVYMENTKTNNNSGMFAIMLETEAGSGVYEKSTTSTWPGEGYVFNENLSSCENGGELSWNEELGAVNLKTNTSERCYVYFDMKLPPTLAEYIINNIYVEDGVNGLYYHDGEGTYTNADQEALDNSYRYSGANPNNYVCFGSDASPCPSDNLYRIIGVFDDVGEYQVKLIKAVMYEFLAWNSELNNEWNPESNIYPDMKNYLNIDYYNTLNRKWQDLINFHEWNVGGLEYEYAFRGLVKTSYNYEISNSNNKVIDIMKIGLMYVSDYGYAVNPDYWIESLNDYGMNSDNWLYMDNTNGGWIWTISRNSDNNSEVFYIINGRIGNDNTPITSGKKIYPCFYLNSDVTYVSGDGSQENPFRIE